MQYNLNTIPHSTIRRLSIMCREEIELSIEVEEEQEEALEEVEDQWYVTIVNNWDTMQGNAHFHQQLVCIVMHQTTRQRNVQHY